MTYLEFLAVFLVAPIAALVVATRGRPARALRWQLAAIAVVAILYTGPWDGALILNSVWSYPPSRVIGASALHVPLEEYGFYVLQTVLAGLVAAELLHRREAAG